jgi:hypothetical protein
MVTTIFETNLSLQDARLNNVMKKLTGWAAIIAVPTAVTGYFGQNVPYPGFGKEWGFGISVAVIFRDRRRALHRVQTRRLDLAEPQTHEERKPERSASPTLTQHAGDKVRPTSP